MRELILFTVGLLMISCTPRRSNESKDPVRTQHTYMTNHTESIQPGSGVNYRNPKDIGTTMTSTPRYVTSGRSSRRSSFSGMPSTVKHSINAGYRSSGYRSRIRVGRR